MKTTRDSGSFRDPSGYVVETDNRIFRTVAPAAVPDFDYVEDSGLIPELEARGWLVATRRVEPDAVRLPSQEFAYLLEHPKLDFISYPYEWPYIALRRAALFHLDLILAALEHRVMLSDASAYNVQFDGVAPVFIDRLSFVVYRDGQYWDGHRQFCEQFLNPLLLTATCQLPYHAWYRGSLEGISSRELANVLPLRAKLSPSVFMHVLLQSRYQRPSAQSRARQMMQRRKLPLQGLQNIIRNLRRTIDRLPMRVHRDTVWKQYGDFHSYTGDDSEAKRRFVQEFVERTRPGLVWDLGCNTGEYAELCLSAGTSRAIGFDSDHGALELAFERSQRQSLKFTPLHLDLANPTPDQGWAEVERKGLRRRAGADAVIALAIVHHLAITKNVPLSRVVNWILDLAPNGVIEFVPSEDPMVQRLLELRSGAHHAYSERVFLDAIGERADIFATQVVSPLGRTVVAYTRR